MAIDISFRVQREIQMAEQHKRTWIPLADVMMFIATSLALLAVGTLLLWGKSNALANTAATGACVASTFLVIGYFPAIAAHYHLIFSNITPVYARSERWLARPEKTVFVISVVVAITAVAFFMLHPPVPAK